MYSCTSAPTIGGSDMDLPEANSSWRHKKGRGRYTVVATAIGAGNLHSETVVIYVDERDGTLYVRHLFEWYEKMERRKVNDDGV